MSPRLVRIVSGGQAGADRAALDAARALGVPYGGWCPHGGWAEDLPEPPGLLAAYPELRETPSADPAQRTRWNVRDSDATLVVTDVEPSDGTAYTIGVAEQLGKPVHVSDGSDASAVLEWLTTVGNGLVLNVAGPRESSRPGSYARTRLLLEQLLRPGRPPTSPRSATTGRR